MSVTEMAGQQGKIAHRKTAPGPVVDATGRRPGPNRPHLYERGSAVGIMLPSESDGNNQGWRANDLTPDDVARMLDRFITKFVPGAPDECWLWRAGRFSTGYGQISNRPGSPLLAHRVAWVAFTGCSLTGNVTIDHLCNNKLCVNPGHLEPVTLHENVRRKNERLGYRIGASAWRSTTRTRRSPRPILDEEDRKQRARDNALSYYYAHRDELLAARKDRGYECPRVLCEQCGITIRHDGLRRHRKRIHGAV